MPEKSAVSYDNATRFVSARVWRAVNGADFCAQAACINHSLITNKMHTSKPNNMRNRGRGYVARFVADLACPDREQRFIIAGVIMRRYRWRYY